MTQRPGSLGYIADDDWCINTLDANDLQAHLAAYQAELNRLAQPGLYGDAFVDARMRSNVLERRIGWIERWIETLAVRVEC